MSLFSRPGLFTGRYDVHPLRYESLSAVTRSVESNSTGTQSIAEAADLDELCIISFAQVSVAMDLLPFPPLSGLLADGGQLCSPPCSLVNSSLVAERQWQVRWTVLLRGRESYRCLSSSSR